MKIKTVIINVDTIALTALAALSAKRYLQFPLLIVDCSRFPEESNLCKNLCDHLDIEFHKMALKPHGQTLDILHQKTSSDILVHLDSDAEVLDANSFLERMDHLQQSDQHYGTGWLQLGSPALEAGSPITWHSERPWIPLCAFKSSPVRSSLQTGCSFEAHLEMNDVPFLPKQLQKLISYRRHLPVLKKAELSSLETFRNRNPITKLPYIYNDTGAGLHESLKQKKLDLLPIEWSSHASSVAHFHGATRNRISLFMPHSANHQKASHIAMNRISAHYADQISSSMMNQISTTLGRA